MIIALLLALLTVIAPQIQAEIINVPDDHETIQDAIRNSENGDTLLVAPGRYNEAIDFIGRNIVLASRFIIAEEERFIEETIIDADGFDSRVVNFDANESEDAQLIGFTLTNGSASFGGGVYCSAVNPTLSHLIITGNSTTSDGAGIYCTSNSEPEISFCTISDNASGRYGGGISLRSSNPRIFNTVITGNSAVNDGAGIYFTAESGPEISSCTITNNEAGPYGGGICLRNSNPSFFRTVFAFNSSGRYGGGIYCTTGSEPTFINCSISANGAAEGRGGVHFFDGATPSFHNSIIWGNDPPEINEGLEITFSDIEDGYEGEGNINENPDFADPDELDFSLTNNSPCIDTGDPDFENDADGTRVDMGAIYYHQTPGITVNPERLNFGEVNLGHQIQQTLMILSRGHQNLEFEMIVIVPEDAPFEIVEGNDIEVLEPGDRHEVIVQFNPERIGFFEADLLIVNNDPENEELFVPLTGIGIPRAPIFNLDLEFLNFGEVVIHREAIENINISNPGEADLIISDIEITGEQADEFSIDFNEDIEIEPEASIDMEISFTPSSNDVIRADITFTTNDPENEGIFSMRVSGRGTMPEPHFDPISNTNVNHSLLIIDALIDEESLAFGSEIAVFTPEGLCAGGDQWLDDTLGFAAWGDNELTEELDGFQENEEMSFRFWDIVSDEEMPATPDWIRGEEVFADGGVSILELNSGEQEQDSFTLDMIDGWNMVSCPIIPEEDDVKELWRVLADDEILILLKDYLGRFYYPNLNYTNIPFWNFMHGYQVKVDGAASLDFVGEFAREGTVIPLDEGWNISAYFPETNHIAQVAFENIVDNLIIAKDGFGRFYYPEIGYSNMGELSRGFGYYLRVDQELEFVWNFPEDRLNLIKETPRSLTHFIPPANTGSNMSILIRADQFTSNEYELGAFSSKDGYLIGAACLESSGVSGMAIWGDDISTELTDGILEDGSFYFTLWDGKKELKVNPSWIKGQSLYKKDGFSYLSLKESSIAPEKFELMSPFPNPFNNRTMIQFSIPEGNEITLTIIDMEGRVVEELIQEFMTPGRYSTEWDAKGLSSGIYMAQLKTEGKSQNIKVVLLR